MQDRYYSFPVPFGRLLAKEELPQVPLDEAVKQHLLLILMTHFEEFRYDNTFGCSIWDEDFELIPAANIWKGKLKRSIEASVAVHEARLSEVKIAVNIGEETFTASPTISRIKKRIRVNFVARLSITNEPFEHDITLFLSPISLD